MELKKLVPWNWFKKEEEDEGKTLPVQREDAQDQAYAFNSPLIRFHREIDRLFDNAFRGFGSAPFRFDRSLIPKMDEGVLKPTLDLGATDKEYTITVEIPGVDEKDVKLEIVNDTLTIRGEKKQEKEEKEKNYYRVERSYGSFQRVLSLPEDADQENVKATFKKGVLTVNMPRRALPQSDVRQIEVKSAQ
jgi:HSP20 family protein